MPPKVKAEATTKPIDFSSLDWDEIKPILAHFNSINGDRWLQILPYQQTIFCVRIEGGKCGWDLILIEKRRGAETGESVLQQVKRVLREKNCNWKDENASLYFNVRVQADECVDVDEKVEEGRRILGKRIKSGVLPEWFPHRDKWQFVSEYDSQYLHNKKKVNTIYKTVKEQEKFSKKNSIEFSSMDGKFQITHNELF
jgi:hypothetical protein